MNGAQFLAPSSAGPVLPQQQTQGRRQMEQQSSITSTNNANVSGPEGRERYARENHSEIERKRRNKMTHYINELADMVPQCAALGRKPDKLTILRMAVSHMKTIRSVIGNATSSSLGPCQPSFLTDAELKHLILEAANGFLFVVACDSARVIFVADSIYPVLNITQEEWINHSFYDQIHPEDLEKVQEQLCGGKDSNLTRVLDLKTGTLKREQGAMRVHLNCRRGFICRMRINGEPDLLLRLRNRQPLFEYGGRYYVPMHCTGYVKGGPPQLGVEHMGNSMENVGTCLVAIARLQHSSFIPIKILGESNLQFMLRVDREGKITFVDKNAKELLNIPLDEILEKRIWTLAHPLDERLLSEAFNMVLHNNQHQIKNLICKWRRVPKNLEEPDFLTAFVDAYTFLNPHSREFEYIIVSVKLQQTERQQLQPVMDGHQPQHSVIDELGFHQFQTQIAADITQINLTTNPLMREDAILMQQSQQMQIDASELTSQQQPNNILAFDAVTTLNWPSIALMGDLIEPTSIAPAPHYGDGAGFLPNANSLLISQPQHQQHWVLPPAFAGAMPTDFAVAQQQHQLPNCPTIWTDQQHHPPPPPDFMH